MYYILVSQSESAMGGMQLSPAENAPVAFTDLG
jgi:hypothetical protein